jgi:DNA-binding NtrC family response regulator
MTLNACSENLAIEIAPLAQAAFEMPDEARLLVVTDDDSYVEQLIIIFKKAGFASEIARNVTDACDAAKSGRFQVVVTVPSMRDGSWQRLVDVAYHYDLRLEIILLARSFDLTEWAGALNDGAFDVLDVLHELPKAGKVATAAFWAAYLKGSGRLPRSLYKSQPVQNAA